MSANALALHGLRCPLADGLEVVGTYGEWRSGRVLIARDRTAAVALSWQRTRMSPAPERTLRRAGREIRRADRQARPEPPAERGELHLARWTSPRGAWHVAFRWFAAERLALVARGMQPDEDPAALLAGAAAFAEDAAWPWRLHGLDVDLPAWWRLAGLRHVAGLARGVWFRHPGGARRADAVFVCRRFALAERLLAGGTPIDWLRANLRPTERVAAERPAGDAWEAEVDAPASTWWRRWRGRRELRRYRLHVEPAADRLVVREFLGEGPPPWS